jgi:hypothetical protein
MTSYVRSFDLEKAGAPTYAGEASARSGARGEPFAWASTLAQPEDPFFEVEPVSTMSEDELAASLKDDSALDNPNHREDFEKLLGQALKGRPDRW